MSRPRHASLLRGQQLVTDRMRAAVREVREGKGRGEVAADYGVSRDVVNGWVWTVMASERDARLAEGSR